MTYLTRSNDKEIEFDNVKNAIHYWTIPFPDDEKEKEYNAELQKCETLDQVADVWNRYTDILFDGSSLMVKEIQGGDAMKYIATGKYIDLRLEFNTREEAEKQIDAWIEADKTEFPDEDTTNDYYIVEE